MTRTVHRARAFSVAPPAVLAAQTLVHAQTVGDGALTQHGVATPQTLAHVHTLPNAVVVQHGSVAPQSITHAHTLDATLLVGNFVLPSSFTGSIGIPQDFDLSSYINPAIPAGEIYSGLELAAGSPALPSGWTLES